MKLKGKIKDYFLKVLKWFKENVYSIIFYINLLLPFIGMLFKFNGVRIFNTDESIIYMNIVSLIIAGVIKSFEKHGILFGSFILLIILIFISINSFAFELSMVDVSLLSIIVTLSNYRFKDTKDEEW